MAFMDNYESVATRIKRFWATYPDGRINVEIIEFSEQHQFIVVKASVYRVWEQVHPSAVDIARGNASQYPKNMQRWFVEDTTTSAIGRAIGLCLGTDERSTKENMASVTPITPKTTTTGWPTSEPDDENDPWASSESSTDQMCIHGNRIWREGEKNGKSWGGWSCPHTDAGNQCSMIWYDLSSDGTWKPQVKK